MLRRLLKKKQGSPSLLLDPRVCFIRNSLVFKGQKSKAEKLVLKSIFKASKTTHKTNILSGSNLLDSSLHNICPNLGVLYSNSHRKRKAVPQLIDLDKKGKLGIKWLRNSVLKVKNKPITTALSSEILSSCSKEGAAYRFKLEHYKAARENRSLLR